MQNQRSTKLALEDWKRLDNLAASTASMATAGQKVGKPSWRALLRRIVRNDEIMLFIQTTLTPHNNNFAADPESGAATKPEIKPGG